MTVKGNLARQIISVTAALCFSLAFYLERPLAEEKYEDEKTEKVQPGIAKPLTGRKGVSDRGMKVFADPDKGGCIACHMVRRFEDQKMQGTIGPPLDGIAAKYSEAQFRQILVDARVIFPETIMPPYFISESLYKIEIGFEGKTILSAQEIEDIISFLLTLN